MISKLRQALVDGLGPPEGTLLSNPFLSNPFLSNTLFQTPFHRPTVLTVLVPEQNLINSGLNDRPGIGPARVAPSIERPWFPLLPGRSV